MADDGEEELLRSVALQNAQSILVARQRAEKELLDARDALERKTLMRRRTAVVPAPDTRAVMTFHRPADLEGVRILIVDDEPDAREMLETMLVQCKAEVTVASSVSEAMDLLRSARPDVLVSDVGMPGEDGYDLIRRVRALSRAEGGRTPAVALTAYARQTDRTEALRAGFDIHVPKPIDPSELSIVIANLHTRHRPDRYEGRDAACASCWQTCAPLIH